MTAWIEALPEVGGRFLERGREIEANKNRLRTELTEWLRAEAKLWTEVAASGEWDRHDIGKALLMIDPELLKFLPEKWPRKTRKGKS